jgi:hypothetical protein
LTPVPNFTIDVIKKLRYFDVVIKLDSSLEPDWDEDNVNHIAEHGLRPEQVEEVYYGEGPFPPLGLKAGMYIEAIVAPYPEFGLWRCVTAFPMSPSTQKAYLRRIKR